MSVCQKQMMEAGGSYPRTCPTCGLSGPCHYAGMKPMKRHDDSCAMMQSCAKDIRCDCGYEKGYYGIKRVTAWPFNKRHHGDGYMIRDAAGYMSWLPKDDFEAVYAPVDGMGFDGALQAMRDGHRVQQRPEPGCDGFVLRIEDGVFIGSVAGEDISYGAELKASEILATDWMVVE